MEYRWSAAAPLAQIPSDGAEFVAVMAKGDWPWRPVWPNWIKGKHDLAAGLGPAAMLRCIVFPDVEGVENGGAVGGQIEGEDPFRRIRRRRVTLISTGKISLLPPGKADSSGPGRALQLCSGASGWNEPAKRQQETRKLWTDAYKSGSGGVHDE